MMARKIARRCFICSPEDRILVNIVTEFFDKYVVPFVSDLGEKFISVSEYYEYRHHYVARTCFVVFYWAEDNNEK